MHIFLKIAAIAKKTFNKNDHYLGEKATVFTSE